MVNTYYRYNELTRVLTAEPRLEASQTNMVDVVIYPERN